MDCSAAPAIRCAGVVLAAWFVLNLDAHAQEAASPVSPAAREAATQDRSTAGRLSVAVVAADTGAPVTSARVHVEMLVLPRTRSAASPVRLERDAETDDRGRAEFTGLPSTLYRVTVAPRSPFVALHGTPTVEIEAGESASLAIRLERTGAITGRIIDTGGDQLPGASVVAIGRATPGRLIPASGYGATDDRGQFRVFDLPPGEYFVVATSHGAPGATSPASVEDRIGSLPTYYPGAPTIEGARAVTVQGGQEATAIDFALVRGRLARVTGTAVDSSGIPIERGGRGGVSLVPRRPEQLAANLAVRTSPDGTFVIENVPPGQYILTAFCHGPAADPEGAFLPVTVTGKDLKVDLRTNAGATLSGQVTIEGGAAPSSAGNPAPNVGEELSNVRLDAQPTAPNAGRGFSAGESQLVAGDGSFRITGVRGSVLLAEHSGAAVVTPLTKIAVLKSIRRGAEDLTGRALDLTGTENVDDLEIVLTTDTGMIVGLVTDAGGKPAPGAWVVVFSQDPKWWYYRSPLVRGSSAVLGTSRTPIPTVPGQVIFPHLLPGRYHVVVFAAAEDYAGVDPSQFDGEALAWLRQRAVDVTIRAGEAATVNLRRER